MASYIVDNQPLVKSDDSNNQGDSGKKNWFKSFNLKKIGGLKTLIIIFILLVVAILLYDYSWGSETSNVDESQDIGYTTSLQYIEEIENKLMEVIGGIRNAGKVRVMISINSSPELKVAETKEEKTVTTSSGTTMVVTSEPIIVEVDGKETPLILKETLPTINGVIVVSSGANDVKVKLDIVTAVSTVLGISPNKIEVFVGE